MNSLEPFRSGTFLEKRSALIKQYAQHCISLFPIELVCIAQNMKEGRSTRRTTNTLDFSLVETE